MKKSVILCVISVILLMLNREQMFVNKICGCGSAILKFKVVLKFLLKRLLNINIFITISECYGKIMNKGIYRKNLFFSFYKPNLSDQMNETLNLTKTIDYF